MSSSAVAARRDQLKITQAEAARLARVSLATWRRFETEPDTQLSDASLQGIARALQLPASTVLTLRETVQVDLDLLPIVTVGAASDEWLAKLNDQFDGDPLTPRQALAIQTAAQHLSDPDGITWQDIAAGRVRVTQAEPFCHLPAHVLIDTNDAWRSCLLDTFAEIAERLEAGRAPYPRCVAEEVALYLTITEAMESPLEELYGEEVVDQLDDYGADEDLDGPLDYLFQDHDFKALWSASNWLEDPAITAMLGTDPGLYHPRNWWKRFDNADIFDG